MGLRLIALLLILGAGQAHAQPPAPIAVTQPVRPIFLPAPVQWDADLLRFRPALSQTATDFANLTGGISFGMAPADLNTKLPEPYPGVSWNALPLANEYPGEVRYFGVPIEAAGSLRVGMTACTGTGSYLVFLFRPEGFFRLSYRLVPDKTCTDTNPAAQQIFGRFVPMGQQVALSVRYHVGKTQVVDITDATAGYLTPIRWRQGGN
ncbi:MAG TPA: hypothetical protein DDZ81_16165 [Acetobacteraceae bacterium]|jgi:hypothetical protein|nr:hypothetical protein [Acetobacteraceae bacterium]